MSRPSPPASNVMTTSGKSRKPAARPSPPSVHDEQRNDDDQRDEGSSRVRRAKQPSEQECDHWNVGGTHDRPLRF